MSDSRSRPPAPRASAPQAALDALLGDASGGDIPMVRRALWLDTLDQRLRPLLPPPLAAHARLANVDGARLVFLVDSPVWHAKLRLAANDLLDAARSLGLDVTQVVVKTARQPPVAQAQQTATPISATANQAVRDALASLRETDAKDES